MWYLSPNQAVKYIQIPATIYGGVDSPCAAITPYFSLDSRMIGKKNAME
jgi:hypothetical protein